MCGSTDLIKQDGVFVCQMCGCKYSIEEARKMMIEGTVEVAGTVKVDNTGLIDSYLQMAENALTAENNAEAENYANKVIELDPKSYRAWFIKGKSAGWQTTGRNNRYSESIVNWINAYQFAPEDKRKGLADEIKTEAAHISAAILQMELNSFAKFPSEDNYNDIGKTNTMIREQLGILKEKTNIDVYTFAFLTILARAINSGAVNASNTADKEFGPEKRNKNKFSWDRYTSAQDRCLSLLDTAYTDSEDDALCLTICNNYVAIAEQCRDSCSYTYSYGDYVPEYSFNQDAKNRRTETINKWKAKRAFHDPNKRREEYQTTLEKCNKVINKLEESYAIQQYWEQHADEKRSLEDEKVSLLDQIEELEKRKVTNPQFESKDNIENRIASLKTDQSALGLFKGKEKKVLQEKIEAAQNELKELTKNIKAFEEQCNVQITSLQVRVDEINSELTKSRGSANIAHSIKPILFKEGSKELAMSPIDLHQFLIKKLPKPYNVKTGTEKDIINTSKEIHDSMAAVNALFSLLGKGNSQKDEWKDDPTKSKNYRVEIYKGDEKTKTVVSFRAKSTNTAIEDDIHFKLQSEFTPTDAAIFTKIVSILIFDLLPSVNYHDLQNAIVAGIYGIKDIKRVASDGIIIEFCRNRGMASLILSSEK